jgi:hypothetical protein
VAWFWQAEEPILALLLQYTNAEPATALQGCSTLPPPHPRPNLVKAAALRSSAWSPLQVGDLGRIDFTPAVLHCTRGE